jgi:hypothetical protein
MSQHAKPNLGTVAFSAVVLAFFGLHEPAHAEGRDVIVTRLPGNQAELSMAEV